MSIIVQSGGANGPVTLTGTTQGNALLATVGSPSLGSISVSDSQSNPYVDIGSALVAPADNSVQQSFIAIAIPGGDVTVSMSAPSGAYLEVAEIALVEKNRLSVGPGVAVALSGSTYVVTVGPFTVDGYGLLVVQSTVSSNLLFGQDGATIDPPAAGWTRSAGGTDYMVVSPGTYSHTLSGTTNRGFAAESQMFFAAIANLGDCGVPTPLPSYYPTLIIPSGESQTVTELDGHSSVGTIDASSIDPTGALRKLFVMSNATGRIARLTMGFPGMSLQDFQTLHTMQVTSIDRSPQGVMRFHLSDLQRLLMLQVWTNGGPSSWQPGDDAPAQPVTEAFTANDQPISSDNPRYVQGNPMDILLVACQNELGLGQLRCASVDQWKIYRPGDDVTLINPNPCLDVPGVLALRESQFSGVRFEFYLTSAQDGKSWIEDQILKPLGLYWIARANGQLSLKSMKQPVSTSPVTVDDNSIIGTPDTERLPIVNVVQVTPGTPDSSQGNALEFVDETSTADWDQQYENDVQADGFRMGWGAFLLSSLLSDKIFRRHASNTPVYTFDMFLAKLKLEVGDFVQLTHRLVLDYKTGDIGITNVLCEVIDRNPDYQSGKISLKCADTRFMGFNTACVIAPAGTPGWSAATSEQRQEYMYISDSLGRNSDGTDGNVIF